MSILRIACMSLEECLEQHLALRAASDDLHANMPTVALNVNTMAAEDVKVLRGKVNEGLIIARRLFDFTADVIQVKRGELDDAALEDFQNSAQIASDRMEFYHSCLRTLDETKPS